MNVSRQCADDFELVAMHYGCPADEVEQMKRCVERDVGAAVECFAALAAELGWDGPMREPERFLTADQWLSLGEQRKT